MQAFTIIRYMPAGAARPFRCWKTYACVQQLCACTNKDNKNQPSLSANDAFNKSYMCMYTVIVNVYEHIYVYDTVYV